MPVETSLEARKPEPPCANCGAALQGPFCAQCGQRRLGEGDRRFAHLVGQFIESLTDLDSRFWRSIRALLFRPGLLSRDYIEGRRVRWLSPVTLFLLANLTYFFAPALTDFSLPFSNQVGGELALASFEHPERLSDSARENYRRFSGQPHSPITSPWVEQRVAQRDAAARKALDDGRGYTVADYARAYDARVGEVSKLLIVLHVPFLALALMGAFRARRLYFAEHFVVALHLFAFLVLYMELVFGLLLMLVSLGLGSEWMSGAWPQLRLLLALPVLLYLLFALRRTYAAPWWLAALGTLATLLMLGAAHMLVYRSVQFLVIFAIT